MRESEYKAYYRPQRSCGKVVFSQAPVILFGGGACMEGGMCDMGGVRSRGLCMAGGMCGRGHV